MFTIEENNAFAHQGFKDFIMTVKEIMEGFGVLYKRIIKNQVFWDGTKQKEDILLFLLCKLSQLSSLLVITDLY